MRIATFNVENLFTRYLFARGVDQRRAFSRGFTTEDLRFRMAEPASKKLTAQTMLALRADVFALQEVESLGGAAEGEAWTHYRRGEGILHDALQRRRPPGRRLEGRRSIRGGGGRVARCPVARRARRRGATTGGARAAAVYRDRQDVHGRDDRCHCPFSRTERCAPLSLGDCSGMTIKSMK